MGPIHRLWALAFDALAAHHPLHRQMMDTEPDFDHWIAQLDTEYSRYRDMCEATQQTPCSLEVLFWEAHISRVEPVVLLRARHAQKKP